MARPSPMTDLYNRLGEVGFPRAYVRERILPDWWEDSLAADPGNRLLAEMAISRTLRIPLESLVERNAPLSLEGAEEIRFKKRLGVEASRFLPAIAVARRVFELLLACVTDLPACRLEGTSADSLRERILAQAPFVTLANLIQFAWDFGVPVVHLDSLPDGAKRVDGMVFCVGGRPCIALASALRSPAWLIWHLAHEMGHVAAGHVAAGAALDIAIDFGSEQADERTANLFAKDLVYGRANRKGFATSRHIKGAALAEQARSIGPMQKIFPACIVTSYAFNMKAWGTAHTALKALGASDGGPELIRRALEERVDLDSLSETDRHFFVKATGLTE